MDEEILRGVVFLSTTTSRSRPIHTLRNNLRIRLVVVDDIDVVVATNMGITVHDDRESVRTPRRRGLWWWDDPGWIPEHSVALHEGAY